MSDTATRIVDQFERGELSRRQLVTRLMGLGAALAVLPGTAGAQEEAEEATFQGLGLDHIALDVTDVSRSRDFYIKHLGLRVIREQEGVNCFLGREQFFLTLFRAETAGLNHYCYAIPDFDPGKAAEKLKAAGLEPKRRGNRIYFDDPDGIEVQVTGS